MLCGVDVHTVQNEFLKNFEFLLPNTCSPKWFFHWQEKPLLANVDNTEATRDICMHNLYSCPVLREE